MTIVDSAGHTVATIAAQRLLPAQAAARSSGTAAPTPARVVPDGVYYPSVDLPLARRSSSANKITVDTQPPRVRPSATRLKKARPRSRGRAARSRSTYRFSEPAHALVYLDGRPDHRSHESRPQTRSSGRERSAASRCGPERTSSRSARRTSPATRRRPAKRKQVTVVVRYVELTPAADHGRAAAGRSPCTSRRRPGATRGGSATGTASGAGRSCGCARRRTPGTYRLVVAENGHAATAVVRVHK